MEKRPTNAAAEIEQRQRINDLIIGKEIGKHRHVFRIHDGVILKHCLRSPTSRLEHRGHTIILSSKSKRFNHEPRGISCHGDSRPVFDRQEQRRINAKRAEPRQGKASFQEGRGKQQRGHQQRGRRQRQRRRCLEFHHCQDRQQWGTALVQIPHSRSALKTLAHNLGRIVCLEHSGSQRQHPSRRKLRVIDDLSQNGYGVVVVVVAGCCRWLLSVVVVGGCCRRCCRCCRCWWCVVVVVGGVCCCWCVVVVGVGVVVVGVLLLLFVCCCCWCPMRVYIHITCACI